MDKKYISCLVNDKVGVCAISLVLDKRHVRNGGKYPIALRFTIDRKRLYYPLGDKYTEKEFDAICRAKNTGRRSNIKSEKETNFECKMLLEQTFKSYVDIVQDLDKTSKLSLNMIMTRLTGKNEEDSFLLVWEDIINNRSVGTADSYTTAKKSFIKYVGVISGFNVSKSTIEKWIKGMENDGFTKTTIGIYLRACRVVWNECTQRGFLSKKEYPFGKDKSLITIPVGSTRKKEYLNVEQMTELYQVFINKKYPESWRKSYIEKVHFSLGLFLVQYLCNGFNLADAARLRYNDYYYISGKQSFQFMRYKTKDRSENNSEVVIPIIEPLRMLFKDEVRKAGLELGLSEYLVYRQPFPGPGLGVRIIGEVTAEKVRMVQEADAIYREELEKAGVHKELGQYFAALSNMKTVGCMGDGRTYDYAVVLRAVMTTDFMTAESADLPWEVLGKITSRIVNEVKGVNRVMYDCTGKPPATIEFE